MTPEARIALECIQDATNREEAELMAFLCGYDTLKFGSYTAVCKGWSGWVMDLYDHDVESFGELHEVPYSQIKHVLQEEVARDLS